MKKIGIIFALAFSVCLMSATTSNPTDVKTIKTDGHTYSIVGSFKAGEITTNASGDYGWQGCNCYHVSGCGTAFCAVQVAQSECINRGIPKPVGCR